jgi:hypothetical protein
MTSHRELIAEVLPSALEPALVSLGFSKVKPLHWRRGDLEVRTVVDSKAADPFRGGAFTLEFEKSDNGQFEMKLAGRARVDQLLDAAQRQRFLTQRNIIASHLQRPDDQHVAMIPESVRPEYLKAFQATEGLEPRFWMRFGSARDLQDWCELLGDMLTELVARAETLDPHALVLGRSMTW